MGSRMGTGEGLDDSFIKHLGVTKDDKVCKYHTEIITRQKWKTW